MTNTCSDLELIFKNVSSGMLLIQQRQIRIANPKAVEILGIPKERLIGEDLDRALPVLLAKRLYRPSEDRAEDCEIQIRRHQIRLEQCRVNGDGEKWIVLLLDVTEERRMEAMLSAVNFSESLGFVFSGIRHEIGNPVNSIKMALSVLKRDLDLYDKKTIGDFVNRALKEVGRMEYLLKALKNYSLFEKPEMHEISVETFISDFKTIIENDCRKNGIRFKALFSPAVTIWADERALHQILLNLFSNALDALQGVEIPHIAISAYEKGNRVEIKVDDNGRGIPEEKQKRLFQPFFTTKSSGTGLGLVIVKKMVNAMNGEIFFESYPSIGTVFTISLYQKAPE